MSGISFRQDLGLKIASLVLSLLIWLHVQSQQSRETEFGFEVSPVEIVNIPEGIVVRKKPTSLSVTVKGPPDLVEEFKAQNRYQGLSAYVDAASASAEEAKTSFPVDIEPRATLRGLRFTTAPTADVEFENEMAVELPVEVVPAGVAPEGFEFGSAAVNPETVNLVGPQSVVTRIGSVRAPLSLADVRSGATYRVKIDVLDRQGNPVSADLVSRRPSEVEVTLALAPAKPRRTLLVSPRYSGAPHPGFHVSRIELSPSQVVAQGERSKMAALSIIQTAPISLAGVQSRTVRQVRLQIPEGITVQGSKTVTATIFVEPDSPAPAGPEPPKP